MAKKFLTYFSVLILILLFQNCGGDLSNFESNTALKGASTSVAPITGDNLISAPEELSTSNNTSVENENSEAELNTEQVNSTPDIKLTLSNKGNYSKDDEVKIYSTLIDITTISSYQWLYSKDLLGDYIKLTENSVRRVPKYIIPNSIINDSGFYKLNIKTLDANGNLISITSEPIQVTIKNNETTEESIKRVISETETRHLVIEDSFSCLNDKTKYPIINTSLKNKKIVGSQVFSPPKNSSLDLTSTEIFVHGLSDDKLINGEPKIDSKYGLIRAKNATQFCVAGGIFFNPAPWDISWEENYDVLGSKGLRKGTTRNNNIIDIEGLNPVVTGTHWSNMHDGPRFNSASGFWRLQHSWGEYTRDDCIENDKMKSGIIYDSLFDGCFSGYSNRAGSVDDKSHGKNSIVEFNKVLLRMELMPGPPKQCEKTSHYFGKDKQPFNEKVHGSCNKHTNIYGTGNLFKLDDIDRNPKFSLVDSVFLIPVKHTHSKKADFPNEKNMLKCENITIVYLGEGKYPGYLPDNKFPNCFNIITGQAGMDFWEAKVKDWHLRHPDVGSKRKPSSFGSLKFPRGPIDF